MSSYGRRLSHALVALTGACALFAPTAAAAAPGDLPEPTGDAIAPAVGPPAADPAAVPAAPEDRLVTVSVRLTDAASGVASAAVRLAGPEQHALRLVSGTSADGVWTATVPVPAFTPPGPLDAHLAVADAAGNPAERVQQALVTVKDVPPAAPAQVVLEDDGSGTLRVAWVAPPANGGTPLTGYDVTLDPGTTVGLGADARSTTFGGLQPGATYAVRVAARNAAGTGPALSSNATMTAAAPRVPAAPGDISVAPAPGALLVTWSAPVTDGGSAVTEYDVTATSATAPAHTLRVTDTAAVLTGLVDGATYDVAVVARNAAGAGLAATAQGVPRSLPGAPRITAVVPGDGSVRLTWQPPASDGGAAVERYEVTGGPAPVVVPGTQAGALVTGLPNGAAVTLTVTAVNAAGPGVPATARATPRMPVRIVVVAQPAASVVYGTATETVAGLFAPGNVPIANARIELWGKVKPSTSWQRLTSGSTDSHGKVRLRATLIGGAGLLLRHPADAFAASDVVLRSVSVVPRVRVTSAATTLRIGRTLTVSGAVAPAQPTGSAMKLQRHTGSGWVTVATGAMTTTTAFRVTWKPGAVGSYPLRVVRPPDADHALGVSATWRTRVDAESATDIARAIAGNSRVVLDRAHLSGISDQATAWHNIADVAAGRLARRSAYENAPGGYTTLDLRLLRALRRMGQAGRVTVSEIAGGSHSRGSTHYYGRGLDIRAVNGVSVRRGTGYWLAVDACRAFGASRVFHPSYDPYGGHQGHVHCDWE